MAKLKTPAYFIGGREIGANSLDITSEDLVTIKSGFANKAIAGDKVEGISVETKTFEADNETVKKSKLEFVRLSDETIVEVAVEGGTISQENVGSLYNLNANGNVDGGLITPVAQVDTLTLTGTSGTATITGAGDLSKVATFNTSLTQTASDFVTANADAYAEQGITLTSSGDDLIFTASIAGDAFTSPSIANTTGDLAGTVANTTANVSAPSQLRLQKVITSTLGDFVRAK